MSINSLQNWFEFWLVKGQLFLFICPALRYWAIRNTIFEVAKILHFMISCCLFVDNLSLQQPIPSPTYTFLGVELLLQFFTDELL